MARLESCPTCGNETSENVNQCPACGEPLSSGWADTVREQKAQAVLEHKGAKWKKRLIWGSILGILIVWAIGRGVFGESGLEYSKEIDPAEIKMRILKLEEQVAKVATSDFNGKIQLYRELQTLDPDNAQYAAKITPYQRKKEEAEATAIAEKIQKLGGNAVRDLPRRQDAPK